MRKIEVNILHPVPPCAWRREVVEETRGHPAEQSRGIDHTSYPVGLGFLLKQGDKWRN